MRPQGTRVTDCLTQDVTPAGMELFRIGYVLRRDCTRHVGEFNLSLGAEAYLDRRGNEYFTVDCAAWGDVPNFR
jgi:hypothetical protein